MKRTLLLALVAASAALLGFSTPAKAETSVGVDIHIGDPYRGASIRFESAPRMVLVPESKVYYCRENDFDSDIYRYGRYWYFVEEGRWYRANSYRGPFYMVRVTSVPRSVLQVPPHYRRNWNGPPPHAVARGYYKEKGYDRHHDRDGWRSHERGHGRND